ncbi:MAG: YihY/virulence factor BrkB family protein [Bacteroidetes bacterium]|nr:MAG: YihY/virulence factor BrkB family protein [Bacteroidota bacterium]
MYYHKIKKTKVLKNKKAKFLQLKPIQKILDFSKKVVIPGFDGIPLYYVAAFFFKGISKGYLTTRAAAIAFSFFLAIFPIILVFFTLIPFIPINNFQEALMAFINNIVPNSAESTINSTLIDIIERPRGGLLSLTFFLALFFATNGFSSIVDAFNNTYHPMETKTWFKQRLIALVMFSINSLIVIIAIVLLTSGSSFFEYLLEKHILNNWTTFYLLEGVKWVILTSMFFFSISFIYYLAPAKKNKFRFISAGSSLATFLSIIASVGFNFYVQNFSSYNALYGSIGTLLIILMWIYFNAIILLIGFELNASIQQAKNDSKIYFSKDENFQL